MTCLHCKNDLTPHDRLNSWRRGLCHGCNRTPYIRDQYPRIVNDDDAVILEQRTTLPKDRRLANNRTGN